MPNITISLNEAMFSKWLKLDEIERFAIREKAKEAIIKEMFI